MQVALGFEVRLRGVGIRVGGFQQIFFWVVSSLLGGGLLSSGDSPPVAHQRSDIPPGVSNRRWTAWVSLHRISEGDVTRSAPHKASKLIT